MTILVLPSNSATGYNLTKSLRFRSSASASLTRTVTGVNTTQLTFSFWLKYSVNPSDNVIYATSNNASNYLYIGFNSSYALDVQIGATANRRVTTQVFRDPSAWYHIVVTFDTTQATASDRIKIYVNGSQVTAFSTNTTGMSQNSNLPSISSTLTNYIGNYNGSAGFYYDGYMAELNAVYGQALTPSSFGSTNSQTGVWQPARYTGTYGTNGFYLPFTNTTSTSTLGNDFSGNGNNWTTNNISLTSGVTYDSMNDVPTLTNATTANYCVMNPLYMSGTATPTNGNLTVSQANNQSQVAGTFGMSSGKWYYEHTVTAVGGEMSVGIGSAPATGIVGATTTQYGYYNINGQKYNNNAGSSYGATFTTGDVIGVAYDADVGSLTFYKNGTTQGTAFTGITGTMFPLAATRTSGGQNTSDLNFGQRPFAYTPPTGFVALNTFNLPTPTIGATASTQAGKYFNPVLYTGNGATGQTITGVGFQPDFVWAKSRSNAYDNGLQDAVRGATKDLNSNNIDAEETRASSITAFASDGFTLGGNDLIYNGSGATYVAWNWKANGSGSSNTAGSITSTVSVNTTSGFSIVTYTGNGSSGTVGHGLGVAPSMIIVKSRSTAQRWTVYHISTSNAYIYLNETFAAETANAQLRFGNNSSVVQPTSTVFSIGNSVDVNQNTTTYVAYCFAQIAGYSAFGSYTGNGSSNGPFVYTGFRPRYVMTKRTDSSFGGDWYIYDAARDTYNVLSNMLYANGSAAESSVSAFDFLSNGFKVRSSAANFNASGGTYIYMAFAESPFKYANAR